MDYHRINKPGSGARSILGLLIILGILLSISACLGPSNTITEETNLYQKETLLIQTEGFLNKDVFYSDFLESQEDIDVESLIGAILPHHNVAHSYFNRFYYAASKKNYDLIVLISPNHFDASQRFSVVTGNYQTYEGMVESHHGLVEELVQQDLFRGMKREMMEIEHGIGVHIPYIKAYCKDAKILGICIGETRDLKEIRKASQSITKALHKYCQEGNILFVASIDFSHYLTYQEALKKDAYTAKLLIEHDEIAMSKLGDAYIDSPSTYGLFMNLLDERYQEEHKERKDYLEMYILEHGNSELFSPIKNLKETTSYFFVSYGKK